MSRRPSEKSGRKTAHRESEASRVKGGSNSHKQRGRYIHEKREDVPWGTTMNRSYLRVRVGTSISPYRGSTCYKRRAAPFQNIHRGPQADIEKGTKRVYLPLQYSGMYHGSIY